MIVDLPDGNKGLWMGRTTSKKIVLCLHGGGFAMPGSNLHLTFSQSILDTFEKIGTDVAIFFVTYTPTPCAIYPQQLVEAVGAMHYLLESRLSENILLAGDSAGGKLALAILSLTPCIRTLPLDQSS